MDLLGRGRRAREHHAPEAGPAGSDVLDGTVGAGTMRRPHGWGLGLGRTSLRGSAWSAVYHRGRGQGLGTEPCATLLPPCIGRTAESASSFHCLCGRTHTRRSPGRCHSSARRKCGRPTGLRLFISTRFAVGRGVPGIAAQRCRVANGPLCNITAGLRASLEVKFYFLVHEAIAFGDLSAIVGAR